MGGRSWCQSRCILIKGILCLGGVDIGAERHAVGSLFTASLSPNKGGQRRRRKGGGGPAQRCPLSSDTCCWLAADIEDTVWLCLCVSVCACEWVKDWERERRNVSLTPASSFFFFCRWGGSRLSPLESLHFRLRRRREDTQTQTSKKVLWESHTTHVSIVNDT